MKGKTALFTMLAGGWNAGDKVVKIADEAIWNHAKGYVGGADDGRVSPHPHQPPFQCACMWMQPMGGRRCRLSKEISCAHAPAVAQAPPE